jgi:hypothetical protein
MLNIHNLSFAQINPNFYVACPIFHHLREANSKHVLYFTPVSEISAGVSNSGIMSIRLFSNLQHFFMFFIFKKKSYVSESFSAFSSFLEVHHFFSSGGPSGGATAQSWCCKVGNGIFLSSSAARKSGEGDTNKREEGPVSKGSTNLEKVG